MRENEETKSIKRKCKFRVVEYVVDAETDFTKNINAQQEAAEKRETETRKAAKWQNGFCYKMSGQVMMVEGLTGLIHKVGTRDIQFLDTKGFYKD